jgi:hypothetical protein
MGSEADEANLALHYRICKSDVDACEKITQTYGKVTVAKSEKLVVATGPDMQLGTLDDLLWYDGVVYGMKNSSFEAFCCGLPIIGSLFLVAGLFLIRKRKTRGMWCSRRTDSTKATFQSNFKQKSTEAIPAITHADFAMFNMAYGILAGDSCLSWSVKASAFAFYLDKFRVGG